MKLNSYEDWKHCITVSCGIPLTPEYIETRITDLNNMNNHHTQKFLKTWGETHREKVISWFERARIEISN